MAVMSGLQDELVAAFPPQPIPESLFDDPRGSFVTTYPDDTVFIAGVRDRAWNELTSAFVVEHGGAPSFMTPAMFVALIPAYLAALLRDDIETWMPENVLRTLTRQHEWDPEFDGRMELLTPLQRSTIARVLDALLASDRYDYIRDRIAAARASWQ